MTATSHALIGVAIAAKISNPALAIPIAIASHVVLDLVPHWDPGTNRKDKTQKRFFLECLADFFIALSASILAWQLFFPTLNLVYTAIIVFSATLPDWLMTPYIFLGIKQFKWAYDFGHKTNSKLDAPWGVFTQAAIVAVVIFAAIR